MVSLDNTPSKHLQHSTEPTKKTKKDKTFTKKTKKDKTFTTTFTPHQQPIIYINHQLFTFTTTFTPHQQLIIHTQMEQKPWAKPRRDTWRSVACSRWWLCLPVCERNRPHTHVWGGASGAHWWARQFAATLWHPLSMAIVLIQCINNTSTQCIQNTCSCVDFFNYLVSEPDP